MKGAMAAVPSAAPKGGAGGGAGAGGFSAPKGGGAKPKTATRAGATSGNMWAALSSD